MEKKLEFFYFPECPFCDRVLREIDRLDILVDYKHIYEGPENMERLIADTGKKTTPCLYIDNSPMHESADIINWLQENVKNLQKKSGDL